MPALMVAVLLIAVASVRADAPVHSSQVKPRRFFVNPRQLPAIGACPS